MIAIIMTWFEENVQLSITPVEDDKKRMKRISSQVIFGA